MKKPIVFMFSGQGSQYYQMGKELYQKHPRFKMWMNYCNDIVEPLIGCSLIDIIYDHHRQKTDSFDRLLHSNPALLSIQYSLSRILVEMGLQPDYVLGYSLGELTAAVISGVIEFEEAAELTVGFAQSLEQVGPSVQMLAIIDSSDIMQQYPQLFAQCWLTGRNFHHNFVVSGLTEDINSLQLALKAQNILHVVLPVHYGFHTPLIDPIKAQFRALTDKVTFYPMKLGVFSALTGGEITQMNADYLWHVVRQPVDFEHTIQTISQQQDAIFIDVGPSGSLATFVKYLLPAESHCEYFETINLYGNDLKSLDSLKTVLYTPESLSTRYAV